MSTYAIGDLHGCFEQLQHLLEIIEYDDTKDKLLFTGDLVNGGPRQLDTVRFIKGLGDKCVCVLGNHDVYMLGVAAGVVPQLCDRKIGIDEVLAAPDLTEIVAWMKTLPFAHFEPKFDALLVHAGILPSWSIMQTLNYSEELSNALQGPDYNEFLQQIVADDVGTWSDDLTGWPRIKFLYHCFTRMRFCNEKGELQLNSKGDLDNIPPGFLPWFQIPRSHDKHLKIIFGHWAALMGRTGVADAVAIDTGCVWGKKLTALRLDDWHRFEVNF